MKTETLFNKLQKGGYITQAGKIPKRIYSDRLIAFFSKKEKLYIYETKGTGRYRHIDTNSTTDYVIDLCNKLNLKMIRGNDAPRGGKLGEYIQIKRVNRQLIDKLQEREVI